MPFSLQLKCLKESKNGVLKFLKLASLGLNSLLLFQILTPFLLRRLKSDVTLEVPPKKEIIVYAPLTAKQEAFYTAVVNKTIAKMLGKEKVTPCSCTH